MTRWEPVPQEDWLAFEALIRVRADLAAHLNRRPRRPRGTRARTCQPQTGAPPP